MSILLHCCNDTLIDGDATYLAFMREINAVRHNFWLAAHKSNETQILCAESCVYAVQAANVWQMYSLKLVYV